MPHRPSRPSLSLLSALPLPLLVVSGALHAETGGAAHCAAIATAADRLACYDAVYQRGPDDTRAADAAARVAAALQQAQAQAELEIGVGSTDTDVETAVAASTDAGDMQSSDPRRWGALRNRIMQWLPAGLNPDTGQLVPLDDPAAALANAGRGSQLDRRWELARDSKLGVFNLRSYKPIYALPLFWASDTNPAPSSANPNNTVTEPVHTQPLEGKFQISFKTKIVENLFGDNGDLWGGYTQTSRWQMFNGDESRPFRETNYEPELILLFRNRYHIGEWSGRMAGIGINHQSNGRGDPQSRSWNRIVGTIGLDRENWALVVRPWWRVPEGSREDNNPDIEDYIGRGDAMLVWRHGDHELAAIARHSLRTGDRSRGSLQLDWGFPLDGPLRGHVQVFSGYGESLIDYNHKSTYVGLGISLVEWF